MLITLFFATLTFTALTQTSISLNSALNLNYGFRISGDVPNNYFGAPASYAGDINKDGIDDLIVASTIASPSPSRTNAGIVYVIYGKPGGVGHIDLINTFDLSKGFKISGGTAGDSLGISIAAAGDVNGDGVDDIIIGAYKADGAGGTDTGAVYIIYGKIGGITAHIDLATTLPLNQGFIIYGASAYDQLGNYVSTAGDFNKDGVDDVIIGGTQIGSSGTSAGGVAYVIYGQVGDRAAHLDLFSTPLTFSQGFKVIGSSSNDQLGCSVGSAGDINKDGINDVIIGVCGADIGTDVNAGAALVIYGQDGNRTSDISFSAGISLSEGFQISGPSLWSSLGSAVNPAGDINNDGIDDIIIGVQIYDYSGYSKGTAYVIYGQLGNRASHITLSSGLSLSEGVRITGTDISGRFGVSVSFAGDINQDGIDDVIVGANAMDASGQTDSGGAFVIYGKTGGIPAHIDLSAGLLPSQGYQISGGAANDQAGHAVSFGDYNHDGATDIVVSEKNASPFGRTNAGAVSILYSIPVCPIMYCIQCAASKCFICAKNYLLYTGDNKCYAKGSCPSGTTENSTNCVDEAIQTLVVVQSATSQTATIVTFAISLINFSNPGGMLFSALADILQYMKYMSIAFPPKLQYRLDEPDYSILSIPYLTEAPEEVEDAIPNYTLENNFEKYDIHSGFLVNFWSPLCSFLIVGIAIIFFCCLVPLTEKCKWINSKILKVKEALKWNYLLGTFAESCGPIAFYTSFQLSNLNFETQMESLSFSICLLMNVCMILVLVKTALIAYRLSHEKDKDKLQKMEQKLKDYQVLFENFKDDSFSQQGYFLFSCLRLYLFHIVLGCMYEYPILQAVIFNIQSLLFIFYLLLKRPYKERGEFIMSLIIEVILLLVHASVLGLAMIDHTKHMITDEAIALGEIIIVCNILFISAQCIYLFIQIIGLATSFYKFIKAKCTQRERLPVTVIPRIQVASSSPQYTSNILDQSVETYGLMRPQIPSNNRMDTSLAAYNTRDPNDSKISLSFEIPNEENVRRFRQNPKLEKTRGAARVGREPYLPAPSRIEQVEMNNLNLGTSSNQSHFARRRSKKR